MPEHKNQKKEQKEKKKKQELSDYVKYSGIAFQMIATILLGVWGGQKLDAMLDREFPLFTVVLSLAAVFLSLFISIRDFLKF
ncbi:MAG: AtpZ/AtpI family protein [Bacteroidota bacterium]